MDDGQNDLQREIARINELTGTLIPTPGPNHALPPLNPLYARSTLAALVTFASLFAPFLGGGLGEIFVAIIGDAEDIPFRVDVLVDTINVLIGAGSMVWFWLERRAPNFRLSLRSS